ncbi:MAG: right-handed parallel beta-helix repeat-containing protein, partial [Candidatus Bipolaricaulia bacterium]
MIGKPRNIVVYLLVSLLILFLLLSFHSFAAESDDSEKGSTPLEQQSGLVITNNKIKDNPIAIYVGHKWGKVFVENNVIQNNGEAIRWIMSRDAGQITNNTILNNLVGVKIQDTYSSNTEGLIKLPDMSVNDILIRG